MASPPSDAKASDVTLLTYGAMVTPSLEAADRDGSKEGVEVEVIDLRSLMPFDKEAIFTSVEKTSRVLIVHEDVKTLGLGAELSAVIMEERFDHLDAPVMRVTYPDTHAPFSHVLEQSNLPNTDKISRHAASNGWLIGTAIAMCRMPRTRPARDIALLDRIVARDEQAVAELYDRHHRLLFGLILRILRDRSEAEEVLQEVFVLVWTRAETYNVGLGVAGRVARPHRQKSRRSIGCVPTPCARAPRKSAPLPPAGRKSRRRSAALSEQQRAVACALESLPPEQRLLIEQAYFLGLTQSELAERFNLPLGTVKTRIRTGMIDAARTRFPAGDTSGNEGRRGNRGRCRIRRTAAAGAGRIGRRRRADRCRPT